MAQRIVPLTIDDEFIKGSGVNLGAAGSHDAVVLELTFSEMWHGLSKKIAWFDAHGGSAGETLLSGAEADVYQTTVPFAPLQYPGKMSMTVIGFIVETVNGEPIEKAKVVTQAAYFRVMESWVDADSQSEFSPSVAEQLQNEIDTNKAVTDRHFKDASFSSVTNNLTLTREDDTTKVVHIAPVQQAYIYDTVTHVTYKAYAESVRLVMEEV